MQDPLNIETRLTGASSSGTATMDLERFLWPSEEWIRTSEARRITTAATRAKIRFITLLSALLLLLVAPMLAFQLSRHRPGNHHQHDGSQHSNHQQRAQPLPWTYFLSAAKFSPNPSTCCSSSSADFLTAESHISCAEDFAAGNAPPNLMPVNPEAAVAKPKVQVAFGRTFGRQEAYSQQPPQQQRPPPQQAPPPQQRQTVRHDDDLGIVRPQRREPSPPAEKPNPMVPKQQSPNPSTCCSSSSAESHISCCNANSNGTGGQHHVDIFILPSILLTISILLSILLTFSFYFPNFARNFHIDKYFTHMICA